MVNSPRNDPQITANNAAIYHTGRWEMMSDKFKHAQKVREIKSEYELDGLRDRLGSDQHNPSAPPHAASLSDHLERQYQHFSASAERVKAKYPDQDPAIYDAYLEIYKRKSAEFSSKTNRSNGLPVDPRYVRDTLGEIQREAAREMDVQYPMMAPENKKAYQRLSTEINGETGISYVSKMVYDEENGGFQLAKMGGALLLGGGMFAAASSMFGGVGGWAATAAIGLLTLSAAVLGSNIASQLLAPAPAATPNGQSPEAAVAKSKVKEAEATKEELEGETAMGTSGALKTAQIAARQSNPTPLPMSNVNDPSITAPALASIAKPATSRESNPLGKITSSASLT